MYAWIWRHLPFGLPGKMIGSLVLLATVGSLLWYVVFPWAEPLLPFDDVQVEQESGVPGAPGAPGGGEPGGEDDPGLGDHDIPYATVEPTPSSGR